MTLKKGSCVTLLLDAIKCGMWCLVAPCVHAALSRAMSMSYVNLVFLFLKYMKIHMIINAN